jgi:hypothetical protein
MAKAEMINPDMQFKKRPLQNIEPPYGQCLTEYVQFAKVIIKEDTITGRIPNLRNCGMTQ